MSYNTNYGDRPSYHQQTYPNYGSQQTNNVSKKTFGNYFSNTPQITNSFKQYAPKEVAHVELQPIDLTQPIEFKESSDVVGSAGFKQTDQKSLVALKKYVQFVRDGKVNNRSVQTAKAYKENPTLETWKDAMLHNPPIEMLENLENIPYTMLKKKNFIFPCRIELPDSITIENNKINFKEKSQNRTISYLNKYKDKMCLELSLTNNGVPQHCFLNNQSPEHARIRNTIDQSHYDSNFPTLEVTKEKTPIVKTFYSKNYDTNIIVNK